MAAQNAVIQRRAGTAFTLIELLVVVAIIAVLAGLLLPTLAGAKNKGRAAACLNNVKQWGLAMHMYLEDNHEIFPYEGNASDPINASFNVDAWYNVVPPLVKLQPLKDMYAANNPPLPFSRTIFTCPSVREPPAKSPTMDEPFFMYGFNNRMDPNGDERFRLSQVTRPVDTVLFTENSQNEFPSTSGRFTPARHNFHANLAFVDGHASPVHTNDYRRNAAEDSGSAASYNEWGPGRRVYWYPFRGAKE
jgi:prepilin-type N-terminal cleavage/methylation domain-containing protein/prepilin-type processing-associated H-X9-DG protein